MATIVQADTAQGGDKCGPEAVHYQKRGPHRATFKRFSQHYLSNNNESTVPTVAVHTNAASVNDPVNFASFYNAVFNQGYVNLPFTATEMAMTQAEWDGIQAQCSKFRIAGCGFKIFDIQCGQQTVNVSGSTTTVTNQFTQLPKIMIVKDVDHILATMATISPISDPLSNLFNVIVAPGNANSTFASSFATGQLPAVKWIQPCGLGTTFNAEHSFEVTKGGEVHFIGVGDEYNYHWENPDHDRWQSPLFTTNNPAGYDETIRNTLYYDLTDVGSITNAIQQNLATDVNINLKSIPNHHFIRVPPQFNDIGPININLSIYVEYYMTIEWYTGNFITTRNLTGENASMLAGNFIPYPLYRRNMLALGPGAGPPPTLRDRTAGRGTVIVPPKHPQPPQKRPRDQTDGFSIARGTRFVDVE